MLIYVYFKKILDYRLTNKIIFITLILYNDCIMGVNQSTQNTTNQINNTQTLNIKNTIQQPVKEILSPQNQKARTSSKESADITFKEILSPQNQKGRTISKESAEITFKEILSPQNQKARKSSKESAEIIQLQQQENQLTSQILTQSSGRNIITPQIQPIRQTPISKLRERISKQLKQESQLYVLQPLKSINKRMFQWDQYVWIHEDPTIYFNNYPKLFRKNNFYPIQCCTIQYLRNMMEERPQKKFVIFTSSKLGQSICNQFSESEQIKYIYILSDLESENRAENLKQFYRKVNFTSFDLSLLISKAQYFARSYEKNTYLARFSKINQFGSDRITRMKIKGLMQFTDKTQAKQHFIQLINYLFPESKYAIEIQSFQKQYTQNFSQDIILNWFTRNTFFSNFLNKFLIYTKDIYILPYIRFPLERTFSAIKSIYQNTKHKSTFKSYRRCNMSEDQISSFVNNIGRYVELFGFFSTSLNQKNVKNQSGNCIIVIQVNKQERDKKIDYGYVNFNQFNLNDFNEDEILFNIFNVFKVISVNKDVEYVTISLKYSEFPKLMKHYEISKITNNSLSKQLRQTQFQILENYANDYQIIRKLRTQYNVIKASGESCQQYLKLQDIKYRTHVQLKNIQIKTRQLLNTKHLQTFQYYELIVKHLQKLKGFDILLIANVYKWIAWFYKNERNYSKALQYYENQLQIKIRNFGQTHLSIAHLSYNIASLYDHTHVYEKSMHYYKKALHIYQKEYGSFNLKTITTLHHIGCLYEIKGFYDKALRLYKTVFTLQLNQIGQNHLDTVTTMNNIGNIHCNQGNFDQALNFYQRSLMIYKNIGKEQSNQLATTYLNIGKLYKIINKSAEALSFFNKAYKLRQNIYGSTHQLTLSIEKKIKQLKSEKITG